MSIVAVHGPNTMFTTEGGGAVQASTPAGATATKSPANGLSFDFSFPNPGARLAADFDWTFTGPGNPAAQADRFGGTVVFTGAGAGTIVCTVAAGAGPPAGGAYTINVSPTAGMPRSLPPGGDEGGEGEGEPQAFTEEAPQTLTEEGGYDPGDHSVDEVKAYADGLETAEEVQALIDAEIAGKNRTTLLAYLEQMLPYDPDAHTVADVVQYATDNPDELTDIIAAERAGKNRSTLLSQLEALQTT